MQAIFAVCALVGGTILAIQLCLNLLGLGFEHGADIDIGDGFDGGGDITAGHTDGDTSVADGHHEAGFTLARLLTLQTMVAFMTFFGLSGLGSLTSGRGPAASIVIASLTGVVAMVAVGYLVASLRKLQHDGTVRIGQAIGCRGRVYLRIPGDGQGIGKVTLSIQGRTMEYKAKTTGPELTNGAPVVVRRILDSQTVEVAAVDAPAVRSDAIPSNSA